MSKFRYIIEQLANQLRSYNKCNKRRVKFGKPKKRKPTYERYNYLKRDWHTKAHSKIDPKKDKFTSIVNNYHKSEYTDEN